MDIRSHGIECGPSGPSPQGGSLRPHTMCLRPLGLLKVQISDIGFMSVWLPHNGLMLVLLRYINIG